MALNEDQHIIVRFWGINDRELANDDNTKYVSIETSMPQRVMYCMSPANNFARNDPKLFVGRPKNIGIQPGADQEIKHFIFYALDANKLCATFNEVENGSKFRGWVCEEEQLISQDSTKSCAELVWYLLEEAGIGDLSNSGLISSSSEDVDTFEALFQELFDAKNIELVQHAETQEFLGTEGQTLPKRCVIL